MDADDDEEEAEFDYDPEADRAALEAEEQAQAEEEARLAAEAARLAAEAAARALPQPKRDNRWPYVIHYEKTLSPRAKPILNLKTRPVSTIAPKCALQTPHRASDLRSPYERLSLHEPHAPPQPSLQAVSRAVTAGHLVAADLVPVPAGFIQQRYAQLAQRSS